jgi:hypothetical protein
MNTPKKYRVKNWSKYQSGRRQPGAPWIRLYHKLLDNRLMAESMSVKGLWPYMLLVAGEHEGYIEVDEWLASRLHIRFVDLENAVKSFIHLGLIENVQSVSTDQCTESVPRGEESREEKISCAERTPHDRVSFDAFWETWPRERKVRKKQAREQWERAKVTEDTWETKIRPAVERVGKGIRSKTTEPRFVPHPDRWIRDRRWEDEPEWVAHTEREQEKVAVMSGWSEDELAAAKRMRDNGGRR